jgi:hypothetical protein
MEGKVKLFWKHECRQCSSAKRVGASLSNDGIQVVYYNLDTVEGMAEAAYYSILSTPTIIIEDPMDRTVADFRGFVPTIQDIKDAMRRVSH